MENKESMSSPEPLFNIEEMEDYVAKLLADKQTPNTVTATEVNENMKDYHVTTEFDFGKPITCVTVKMLNGFTLSEMSTCVAPENYDESIGKDICLRKIEDKVWFLLGYALQEKLHVSENTYKGRLFDEYVTLRNKYHNGIAYLETSVFKKLDSKRQFLIVRQLGFMRGYLNTLIERCRLEGFSIAPLKSDSVDTKASERPRINLGGLSETFASLKRKNKTEQDGEE